ncbi:AMP-binding protein (plasmid) [Paraburkholderia sp. D15]|uniref:AMP-binding protein n=1 Tax=Paraburkholderia sp. D15 TaxID=2880218 RepID=UPI00247A21E6|nr:AMP-binding protein [Paraburkholderia sp. D15]WGS55269.1 AMP-binding protein [Paraburkholderia sp. D15]
MPVHDLQDIGGGTASAMLASRAKAAPDNVALVFEGQNFSYRELDEQASAAGSGLMALGLKKGDAVGFFMTNRPEYLFGCYGSGRAGLVQVSINTAYKATFLHYTLEHSEAKVLVTEARLAEALMTLGTLPTGLRTIVYLDGMPKNIPAGDVDVISWEEMLAKRSHNPEFPTVHPHDASAISFTSGTTGRSKGVVSPALQGVVMAREAAHAFGITPRDRMYTCMPLFHGMAQVTTCLAAIYAGATIVLSRRFSVTQFWEEIRESGATQASALGSMLHMLLSPPPSPRDLDHKVVRMFSAPAPADVLYRFERRYGVHVIEGYGSTEIKNVLYNPIHGRKVGSMGLPTATSIMEIHDEDGNTLPPGEVGEIVYRPRIANIMLKHYHKEPEKTLENMRDMWWHTGDMGSMDSDGFFYFFDRKSDALRRRGENISSQEVEMVLTAYPGIRDAAAVAAHSEVGEDDVLVVLEVANAGGFDFNNLFRHCVEALPRFMVPRYYRLIETLPRTPTGKIQKAVLRQEGLTVDTWDHVSAGLEVPR